MAEKGQEVGDRGIEANEYCSLGNAYHSIGDFQKAIEYHNRYLKSLKELGERAGEGGAYCNLGNAYNSIGEFQKALEYHERYLKWETGQEKQKRTVILETPITVLEISRKP